MLNIFTHCPLNKLTDPLSGLGLFNFAWTPSQNDSFVDVDSVE